MRGDEIVRSGYREEGRGVLGGRRLGSAIGWCMTQPQVSSGSVAVQTDPVLVPAAGGEWFRRC